MDQQGGQSGVPGPAGRKLHIAHRRSPSELTPLMSTFFPTVTLHLIKKGQETKSRRVSSGTIGHSTTD